MATAQPGQHVQEYQLHEMGSDNPSVTVFATSDDQPKADERLREELDERHVSMIAFSGTIGIGIFLTCGKILHDAGPGGAILAYVLTGTVIWSVIASLGEMTALMPVRSPITEFAFRYVDEAVGFATGWMYWFSYVCSFAAQITASSSLMAFNYDEAIVWTFGERMSPVLWIFLLLIYMTVTNLLPVRLFGEYEYICGCVKMVTITGLILLMVIITNGSSSLPHGEKIGDKYWSGHWAGFFARSFSRSVGNKDYVFTGDTGRLLGLWSGMTNAVFSYIGMDIVAAAAAENKSQGNSESIKMATRKINLRIILLYFFAIVTVSFPVAYDDRHLIFSNHGLKSGTSSPFMIAIFNAAIPVLPHILNAFFIFSSSSAGINSLYTASRTLHALASSGRVLEGPIARRLRLTSRGVPVVSVLTSASFGLLAFMSTKTQPQKVLQGLITNSSVSILLVYMVISLAFIYFYRSLGTAQANEETREYRKRPTYPYKSHIQWARAVYAFVGCSLLIFFNGWDAFLGGHPPADKFIPSYISIFVFIVLIFSFKLNSVLRHNGTWTRAANMSYDNWQEVQKAERRGSRRDWSATQGVVRRVAVFLRDWVI
ncbi:MAG: hypothetical protein M1839_003264 [Geoglossum umbratile]|nr:MAG: hypothetical protein M1839_003264 [Geoglossum umbratile]